MLVKPSFTKSGVRGGPDLAAPEFLEEGGAGRKRWGAQGACLEAAFAAKPSVFLRVQHGRGVACKRKVPPPSLSGAAKPRVLKETAAEITHSEMEVGSSSQKRNCPGNGLEIQRTFIIDSVRLLRGCCQVALQS